MDKANTVEAALVIGLRMMECIIISRKLLAELIILREIQIKINDKNYFKVRKNVVSFLMFKYE